MLRNIYTRTKSYDSYMIDQQSIHDEGIAAADNRIVCMNLQADSTL